MKRNIAMFLIISLMCSSAPAVAFAETSTPAQTSNNTISYQELPCRNKDSNCRDFTWEPVDGTKKYTVHIYDGQLLVRFAEIFTNYIEVQGLDPEKNYRIEVRSVKDSAETPPKDPDSEDDNPGTDPENPGDKPSDPPTPPAQKDKAGAVTGVKTVRGYHTVKITWKAAKNATGYRIYCAKYSGGNQKMPPLSSYDSNEKDCVFILKNIAANQYYSVWIVPYVDRNDKETYGISRRIKTAKAHTLYYTLKLKKTVSQKCQCKTHRAVYRTFKKNSTITGYFVKPEGVHKYKTFKDGHVFYVKADYCNRKTAKSHENAKEIYTKEEAERFIDEFKPKSKTNYVMWASLHTQHVYIFKKINGRYQMVNRFICGSGKAATPTATSTSKKKTLWKKYRKYHNRNYWNCFAGPDGFHGLLGKEKLDGRTKSHGCIRVNDKDSKYIYKYVPKKTRVIVY